MKNKIKQKKKQNPKPNQIRQTNKQTENRFGISQQFSAAHIFSPRKVLP